MIEAPPIPARVRGLRLLAALWLLLGFGAALPASAADGADHWLSSAAEGTSRTAGAAWADLLDAATQLDDDRDRSGGDGPPAILAFGEPPSKWGCEEAAPRSAACSSLGSRRASPFHARAPPLA